eukprot:1145950-Pelagomonas_calceolata.AAC.1
MATILGAITSATSNSELRTLKPANNFNAPDHHRHGHDLGSHHICHLQLVRQLQSLQALWLLWQKRVCVPLHVGVVDADRDEVRHDLGVSRVGWLCA